MRLLSSLKVLSLIVFLVLLINCKKNNNSGLIYMNISSVCNNEIFFRTEVWVEIKTTLLNYQIKRMAYYMDDVFVGELTENPSEYKIELGGYELGEHVLKVVLEDNLGNEASDERRIIIHESIGESPNMVSFSEGLPNAWETDSWELNNNLGYEGSHSMQLSGETGSIMTTKTYEKEGNVNFRIKNTSGELFFYIDGKLKAKWFGEEEWFSYSYYVGEGTHSFKWKGVSPTITLDEIKFVEGIIAHSIGEYFGGGIIYHLDSSKEHGLIVNKENIGSTTWGCGDFIFGNMLNIYDGAANTLTILSICNEENIAARLCFDHVVLEENKVYDDWFLPAPNQLSWLYENRNLIHYSSGDIYWTSYSYTSNVGRFVVGGAVIYFSDGSGHGSLRTIRHIVRPIRAF